MQPFYVPESLGEHSARLSCLAFWRHQVEAAGAQVSPRWRRALGHALVRAGSHLAEERCDVGYSDRPVRLS